MNHSVKVSRSLSLNRQTPTLVWLGWVLFSALVLALCCGAITLHAQEDDPDTTNVETVESVLARMTLRQKIGQLLIFGYSGTEFSSSLKRTLDTYQPGAIITFGRNIKSPYEIGVLNREAQSYVIEKYKVPLLIMVDQEGGSVARIKTNPPAPSALAMGMSGDLDAVKSLGHVVGDVLSLLGFNMNLAPVFDLSDPTRKNFIGNRAFGGDPQLVSSFALAFAEGVAAADLLPTGKHFPGHGGLVQDSHKSTPHKLATAEELEARDLVPFKAFLSAPYPNAVMVAHVAVPKVDPSGAPAAFSKVVIQKILREELAYDGLVITDDIEMLGASFAGSIGDRAVKAIEAGCDMVMVAWSPHRQMDAYKGLLHAVKTGRLTEERINLSLRRILTKKLALKPKLQADPLPPDEVQASLHSKYAQLRELTRKINHANFQKSASALAPELKGSIEPEQEMVVFTADEEFYSAFSRTVSNHSRRVILTRSSVGSIEQVMQDNSDAIGLFYATGAVTLRHLDALPTKTKARMIVVNSSYPGALPGVTDYHAVINLYSQDALAGQWVGETLFKGMALPPEIRQPSSEKPGDGSSAQRATRKRARSL